MKARDVVPRAPSRTVFVAMLVLACGAGHAPAPAAAEPSSLTPQPAPRPLVAIGGNTANRVKKLWEVAAGGFGKGVAISTEAGRVAVSSGSPIRLYQVGDGSPAGTVRGCGEVIRGGLAFVSGKLVAVCPTSVAAYDARTLEQVPAPEIHESRVTAVAFAPPRVAIGHHDGVVRIYGLDGSASVEIPVPGPPVDVKSLALTRDGSKIAVAWVQGSIWWWETAAPTASHKLVRHSNESDAVAFNDDATLFAEEGEPGLTSVWSFGGAPGVAPAEKEQLKNGDWVKRIRFTRDSRWLVRGGSDGLELAELGGPSRVALDTRGQVEDVVLDSSGQLMAAVDRDGRLTVWGAR